MLLNAPPLPPRSRLLPPGELHRIRTKWRQQGFADKGHSRRNPRGLRAVASLDRPIMQNQVAALLPKEMTDSAQIHVRIEDL